MNRLSEVTGDGRRVFGIAVGSEYGVGMGDALEAAEELGKVLWPFVLSWAVFPKGYFG